MGGISNFEDEEFYVFARILNEREKNTRRNKKRN